MKLWLKIFIGTIVVFIIAFDAGALYLTSYSYNCNHCEFSGYPLYCN